MGPSSPFGAPSPGKPTVGRRWTDVVSGRGLPCHLRGQREASLGQADAGLGSSVTEGLSRCPRGALRLGWPFGVVPTGVWGLSLRPLRGPVIGHSLPREGGVTAEGCQPHNLLVPFGLQGGSGRPTQHPQGDSPPSCQVLMAQALPSVPHPGSEAASCRYRCQITSESPGCFCRFQYPVERFLTLNPLSGSSRFPDVHPPPDDSGIIREGGGRGRNPHLGAGSVSHRPSYI